MARTARKSPPVDTVWRIPDSLWPTLEAILLELYPPPATGRLRTVLDGVPFRLRSGVKWNHLPAEFGSDSTVHRWFQRFVADGVFERLWAHPNLTVIGFDSHPLAGSSNQIVAAATARLSFRLAPGQDPDRVIQTVLDHVAAHVGFGLEVTTTVHEAVPAWTTEPTGPAFAACARALTQGFGKAPVNAGMGGSVPFVGPFVNAFGGIPALLIGPEDPHSHAHGEDESLHLDDWRKLIESEIHLLVELASLTYI